MNLNRSRTGSWLLAGTLALGLTLSASGAAANPAEPAEPAGAPAAAAPAGEVVLVTGDRVLVRRDVGGRLAATVEPAARPGGDPGFEVVDESGQLYVFPGDTAGLVPERLDPELFNVTKLLDYGYTGGVRGLLLPAVPGHPAAGPAARPTGVEAAAGLPGVNATTALPSVGGAAVAIRPDGGWWAQAFPAGRAAAAGGWKLWLDEQAEVALAESVPLVGAPRAWAAGYDGTGLTVAVLDTGIDGDHPDLAGRVVADENFTGEPDTADGYGHGTHVAGILAGSGAASGGANTGVAPGAELLNGKVCDAQGDCLVSEVIAGMEWAAPRADVVNLSLGTTFGTDGTDPLSQAVNTLTAAHDTLFVTSAGNAGRGGDGTVGAPGAADAALTVGSVDKDEELAATSSRGPRLGDSAIKPDLTAPGVGIVSARGAGTSLGTPVDDFYTILGGTSMAAPHVAAAAAILLQRDPSLSAAELKAALATTAVPHADLDVYQQGGGRLDVPAALDAPVRATPAPVSLGYFPFPHDDTAPVDAEVTYSNRTDEPVTLELSLAVADRDGNPAPPEMLAVSPATVEVPAGGQATTTVELAVGEGGNGVYGGYLVAGNGSEVVVRTPVGFHKEEEMVELTIRGIDRAGRPAAGSSSVRVRHAVDMPLVRENRTFDDGLATVMVPPGTYSVLALISTYDGNVVNRQDRSLVGDPELTVTGDMTLVLDAREAVPVDIRTPEHAGEAAPFGNSRLAYYREAEDVGSLSYAFVGEWVPTFATPTGPVTLGSFEFNTRTRVLEPPLALSVAAPITQDLAARPMTGSAELDDDAELPLVWAGAGNPSDYQGLDVEGKVVLTIRGDPFPLDISKVRFAQDRGAAALVSMNNTFGRYNSTAGTTAEIPAMTISQAEGRQLRDLLDEGEVTVRLRGTSVSPYLYDLVYVEPDQIPDELRYVADPADLATVVNRFHSGVEAHGTREVRHHWRPFENSSFNVRSDLRTPLERVEYLVPGDTRYRQVISAAPPSVGATSEPLTFYEAGEHREQDWFGSPVRPAVYEGGQFEAGVPVLRDGDTLAVQIPEWVDSHGHWALRDTDVDTTSFRLYADGELLVAQERPQGEFPLRPGPAEYRLEVDVARDAPWWPTSTAVSTAWTVRSSTPAGDDPQPLPLLLVDYDAPVDLTNTLAEPFRATVGLRVRHQPGAEAGPVRRVRLWASYDDGGEWQRIPVIGSRDGGFTALFAAPPPAGAEFVSLRLEAWDNRGNRVEQEVSRAWQLP